MSPQYTIHRHGQAPLSYSVPFFRSRRSHNITALQHSVTGLHPLPSHAATFRDQPTRPFPYRPVRHPWPAAHLPGPDPRGLGLLRAPGGSAPPKKLAIFLGFRPLTCTYLFLREEGDGGEGRRGPLHRVNEGTFPAASTARHWRNFPSPGLLTQLV